MRFAFILNPAANNQKNRERGKRLETLIREYHPSAEVVYSERRGDITAKAKALSATHDVVVVCGGDGSVSELMQGIGGTDCIGGVLPTGSGNDFARGIGSSLHPEVEIANLGSHRIAGVDSVAVDVDGKKSAFQNTLGIGFDGWANYYASNLKFPTGKLKYVVAALKSVANHRAQRFDLMVDGISETCDALMITLANGGIEGGGFYVAPDADPEDGYLDIVIVRPIGKFGLVLRLPFLLFRRQPRFKALERRRCREIRISCHETMAAHADGESLGLHLKSISARVLAANARFLIPTHPSKS